VSKSRQIAINLARLRAAIAQAEAQAGRQRGSVRLLAISKTKSVRAIRAALAAGQHDFGENYLQEALAKIAQLKEEKILWHFVGAIQSNKARDIAQYFDWVHSVERLSIAQRLDRLRPTTLPPLNVCIQVNIDQEHTKAGCRVDQLAALAAEIAQLPRLRLRGLMAIPKPAADAQQQYQGFVKLHALFAELAAHYRHFDTLSAGMSGDFEQAIKAGANLIRIGTAIFGARRKTGTAHF